MVWKLLNIFIFSTSLLPSPITRSTMTVAGTCSVIRCVAGCGCVCICYTTCTITRPSGMPEKRRRERWIAFGSRTGDGAGYILGLWSKRNSPLTTYNARSRVSTQQLVTLPTHIYKERLCGDSHTYKTNAPFGSVCGDGRHRIIIRK